jgi:hypothetical protein
MAAPRALEVFGDIARGLAAAHAAGITHRDLKPENVMLLATGGVKIVDFGLAKLSDAIAAADQQTRVPTQPGMQPGTPAYMAPEQIEGEPVDFRADIFAFGVMLYEAISGVHPFAGASVASTIARILNVDPEPLATRGPSNIGRIDLVVDRCLRKDRALRYGATAEMVSDLEALVSGRTPTGAVVAQTAAGESPPAAAAARWWWQFHQLGVSVAYAGTLFPLWMMHGLVRPARAGLFLFFLALAAVVAVVALRLFLCFASARYEPARFEEDRTGLRAWVRTADWAFGLALCAMSAFLIAVDRPGSAAILLMVAVACIVTFLIVEPATAREAFSRRQARPANSNHGSST